MTGSPQLQHVLYFTEFDISLPDGPSVNEYEFVRALVDRFGARATILLPTPADGLPSLEPARIEFLTLPRFRPTPGRVLKAVRTARYLAQLRRRTGSPFIVSRIGSLPAVLFIAATILRQPVVLKSVGRYWFDSPPLSFADRLMRALHVLMSRALVRRALAVDNVTEQLAQSAGRDAGREAPIHVIQNTTNIDAFRPMDAPRRFGDLDLEGRWPVLGYVGTHPSVRGARQLLEVAARLSERWPKLSVVIAGWDSGMEDVRALAVASGLSNRCSFLGMVPYSVVPMVINLLDIGFSLDDADRARVVGNSSQKVRQYLACGRPVVSVAAGNEFLATHRLGCRVNPTEIGDIARQAEAMIERLEAEGDALRQACRAFAVAHLSAAGALSDRVRIWEEALGAQQGAAGHGRYAS